MRRLVYSIAWPETGKLLANRQLWSAALERIVSAAELPSAAALSVRLAIVPGSRPETTIAITAADNVLARVGAELAAYDGIDGVRVHTPVEAASTGVAQALARGIAVQPRHETLKAGQGIDSSLFMRIETLALLPAVLQAAHSGQGAVAFVSCARRFAPDRESVRQLSYNLLSLEQVPGMPQDLLEDQRRLAQRWTDATWLLDECFLLAPSQPATASVLEALDRAMRSSIYARYGSPPQLSQISAQRSGALIDLRHCDEQLPAGSSSRPLSDIAGKAASAEDIIERLKAVWLATSRSQDVGHHIDRQLAQRAARHAGAQGRGSYVFMSYARSDEARMLDIVRALESAGVSVWFDRQIDVGQVWDAELEARISECTGFIALITREYQASRMCLREIKLADGHGKRLIPLIERGLQLEAGLGLRLSGEQVLQCEDPRVIEQICRLLRGR